MEEAGNPDSNPELYGGDWEPRFEPRALWRRLGTPIRTPSSMEEVRNPEPRGERSKVYKEGSSPVEEGSSSVVLLVNRSLLSQS